MAENSKIEWTESTWTPIRARSKATGAVGWHCEHASPGCEYCYAESLNKRLGTGLPFKPGLKGGHVELFLDEKMLLAPLSWKRPRMIFVCSMTDAFGGFVPDEMLDKMFAVAALCPQHTLQFLTKRSARMREYASAPDRVEKIKSALRVIVNALPGDATDFQMYGRLEWRSHLEPCKPDCSPPCRKVWTADEKQVRAEDHDGAGTPAGECFGRIVFDGPLAWPLPNVWLGVSCEDQENADARIPDLLTTPAALRFVSAEPLLGPIEFTDIEAAFGTLKIRIPKNVAPLHKFDPETTTIGDAIARLGGSTIRTHGINWMIIGGESGRNSRDCRVEWGDAIQAQCAAAGVACFRKQLGARPIASDLTGWKAPATLLPDSSGYLLKLKDSKGGDAEEWPERMRVREFPQVAP